MIQSVMQKRNTLDAVYKKGQTEKLCLPFSHSASYVILRVVYAKLLN